MIQGTPVNEQRNFTTYLVNKLLLPYSEKVFEEKQNCEKVLFEQKFTKTEYATLENQSNLQTKQQINCTTHDQWYYSLPNISIVQR